MTQFFPIDVALGRLFKNLLPCVYDFVVLAVEPSEKSVEIMRKFSEQYARRSGTYFCVDKGVTSVVIKVQCIFGFWTSSLLFSVL